MNHVICLMGPTASGKTRFACELSHHLPVSLISVDSTLVYKGMDIGSAKPSLQERMQYPHALIDIHYPDNPYTVSLFLNDVSIAIDHAFSQKKYPLLVGGTMMYFHALQQGLSDLPDKNEGIRLAIENEANTIGWQALHEQLKTIDIQSYETIQSSDKQRISRALEVYALTGQPISSFYTNKIKSPYTFINIGLMPTPREQLHQAIASRFHSLMRNGFLNEVEELIKKYPTFNTLSPFRAVGYRQLIEHITQNTPVEEAIEKAIIATRQLAKRQMTWLRHFKNTTVFNPYDENCLQEILAFIQKIDNNE